MALHDNAGRNYNEQEEALLKEFPTFHLLPQTNQLHYLFTIIRQRETGRTDFVFYSERIIRLIVEAALNLIPTIPYDVITPTGSKYQGCMTDGQGIIGISILRAGEAMERVLRETCRGVRIGKILVQRDEKSLEKAPDERFNYSKIPSDVSGRHVLLLDPMIATGGSVIKATEILINEYNVPEENIIFLNLISCPEGLRRYLTAFPHVNVVSAALDPGLDSRKYIVPGLGDFGDRYFGTCE
ncbi:uracil phosphoribosyltransferase, putative [Trypanosoma equiperdum]|uniref:uracil phosphoribosyltransferase n=3 Tax=Trypanozoon TaxID=39700 RepID=Q584A9_TRYB2|nr:uracil phosphoribosyltransferase, putative [Trypanosoma brucei gambiense DAL972]XP_844482.1 uracil phosphoribosyltransferase, putative [Trypanosoma brucei brucei TREU927]AAX79806.1 uracil phosphoribosyltransferase, putative [Trypanosoma brucei]SCU69146.1 uracil phosphoribosyltransferase, putative [Trypanosoma equiperdum]AAZ10923.1 uracil phosphoribosyltransferase, putative [Trypanosoma brucei brucei TREU927]CBH10632.1 uracil phosphoribosyltransferase, putative [Trypanosoma brucei gambiense |eukprot:XP_011772920.1 uracil phosphoribosyltransferase, putative [Trypanosoma brucei gambiense DAL972]